MHPTQALIERVEALLKTAVLDARVDAHRTIALNDQMQDLPALIITQGDDVPLNELSTMDELGSLLTITVSTIDKGSDERDLVNSLTQLRCKVHAALMAPGALGFPWAIEVGYAGAGSPVTDNRGTDIAKSIDTRWQVAYRMNRYNPDI